jgi:flagellar basal-body rod protein FlgG
MIRSLSTAATGLEAQAANLERISNDLANVNTDSYKRGRTEFSDLMYNTEREPGAQVGATTQTPVGIQTGMGVKVGASSKIFEQGPAKMTQNPLDLMIEGRGFFPVQTPSGEIAYTRDGNFHRDNQGRVVNAAGALLVPNITIPNNAMAINIKPNGEFSAVTPDGQEQVLGQIQLVTFTNESGLHASGGNLYRATMASGAPLQGMPGEDGLGQLQQGAIEGSNVNVANSMVEMIQTQRAYEMNTKVMKAADDMLGWTANLK